MRFILTQFTTMASRKKEELPVDAVYRYIASTFSQEAITIVIQFGLPICDLLICWKMANRICYVISLVRVKRKWGKMLLHTATYVSVRANLPIVTYTTIIIFRLTKEGNLALLCAVQLCLISALSVKLGDHNRHWLRN